MSVLVVTGFGGLVGSAVVEHFHSRFDKIIGIDNNLRSYFFGEDGSVAWNIDKLKEKYENLNVFDYDIRDLNTLETLFLEYGNEITMIIHSAAQPSHDWAAKEPLTDFNVNALGTINLLELTRKHSPNACFIHMSTNKVYGDRPNYLEFDELESRFELIQSHDYYLKGINESMSIDNTLHSLFGASKLSGDIIAQEYGKYFNMNVGVFRAGCITGPSHSGAKLHGFLAYLIKSMKANMEYSIIGYKGKQVRDNIHAYDLVKAFEFFAESPGKGEVYNIGGGRSGSCSVLEALNRGSKLLDQPLSISFIDEPRIGDHKWWISDNTKFMNLYPKWQQEYDFTRIMEELCE
jgi:CDP-paratose 2-epimerase